MLKKIANEVCDKEVNYKMNWVIPQEPSDEEYSPPFPLTYPQQWPIFLRVPRLACRIFWNECKKVSDFWYSKNLILSLMDLGK